MSTIALPWETWRAIVAVLRAKDLTSMLEHADALEQRLEQHATNQAIVTLTLTAAVAFLAGAVVCPMGHPPRRFLRVRERSLFPN